MSRINLLPARVPIGTVTDASGVSLNVMMTPEFARAFNDFFDRIGGTAGMGSDDLAFLASYAETSAVVVPAMPVDPSADTSAGAQIAALRAEVEALRIELASVLSYAALGQQIDDLRGQIGMIEDPAAQVRYLTKNAAKPALANPTMNGPVAVGSSVLYAREDHVHPVDTSRQAVIAKGTATGSRGGNAALASLLTALVGSGLVNDSTTA